MSPSPWSALFVATGLWFISMEIFAALGDVLPSLDGAERFVLPFVGVAVVLLIGWWRVRVALWFVLVMEVISVVVQLAPPDAWWRAATVVLDGTAALVCARALFGKAAPPEAAA